MGKMRATQHNGRVRKGGEPYSDDHDDRNFDLENASNIDTARTPLNRYWAIGSTKWYSHGEPEKPSFADVEARYYETTFTPMYEASKERSRKRGQLKRVKPFHEWRKARQYVPEETCLQIGSVEDGTVDIKTFKACVRDYTKALKAWNNKHGKPFTILDMAYHFDEATPHAQYRKVWHSINPETGIDEIGQEKALERAGVALPDPLKPVGRNNNRKMTFDREMREKWLKICKSHGIDIETVPEQGRKHNQTKEEYITDKQKAREEELARREKEVAAREEAVTAREKAVQDAEVKRDEALAKADEAKDWKEAEMRDYADTMIKHARVKKQISDLEQARESVQNALQGPLDALRARVAIQAAEAAMEPPEEQEGPSEPEQARAPTVTPFMSDVRETAAKLASGGAFDRLFQSRLGQGEKKQDCGPDFG